VPTEQPFADIANSRMNKTMNKKLPLLTLFLALFLSACTPPTEREIGLDGTHWKLQNMEDQQVLAGTTISLEFRDGQMEGSAGCNAYGAEYAIQARNGINFGSIERNLEACIEPAGVMQQEEQYLRTLWTATHYQAEEDRLTLLDEQGKVLLLYERRPEFQVNPDDLVGRTWQLKSATGLDEERLNAFKIRFEGSEFSGTTVCREYAGNYQTIDDNMNITFLQMTTDLECDELDGRAESEYTTLLENVEQYNISTTTLELFTRRGEKLVFESVLDQ
jgi:heat shock protein HslJ